VTCDYIAGKHLHDIAARIACTFPHIPMYPPWTNFVVSEVLVDDEICRSTADI
jgi:hypothetical protein